MIVYRDRARASAVAARRGCHGMLVVRMRGGKVAYIPCMCRRRLARRAVPAHAGQRLPPSRPPGISRWQVAAAGTYSGTPVLLGALGGLALDSLLPWPGYGPVLGALAGNAGRDAWSAVPDRSGHQAAAIGLGALLPALPVVLFAGGGPAGVALGAVGLLLWAVGAAR